MPLRFGSFTFDSNARELRRAGSPVPLSPKAFRLLELLIDARPNLVPHERLYTALWPDVFVEPGNLHTLVSELRSALTHDAIRTAHRIGYAFAAGAILDETTRYSILLAGEEFPLRGGENVIGRDPRDAVVIHVPDVSRHHAKLTIDGATVTLEDLGSKNGTFLGRRRVTRCEVRPGDEILIGTTKLWLVQVDAMATTATASP